MNGNNISFWKITGAILVSRLLWNIVVCPIAERVDTFVGDVKEYARRREAGEGHRNSEYSPPEGRARIGFKMESERN